MKALIEIQNELKAPKNQYNNFGKYNYRSQEDILEALKPLLKKYKCTLTVSDDVKEVAGIPMVEAFATIRWDNGKEVEEICVTAQAGIDIKRKGMDISQSFGSSSSYARKYALNGLFLIDDTKDADATNEHKEEKDKWFNPNTPEWNKAVSKKISIKELEGYGYSISKENKEKYLKEIS